jgi:hypothetical protein
MAKVIIVKNPALNSEGCELALCVNVYTIAVNYKSFCLQRKTLRFNKYFIPISSLLKLFQEVGISIKIA